MLEKLDNVYVRLVLMCVVWGGGGGGVLCTWFMVHEPILELSEKL